MKVKATAMGFYRGNRIRPGQVFTLADDKHFSAKWMEPAGETAKKPEPKGKGNEPKGSAPEGGSKGAGKPEPKGKGNAEADAGGPPTGDQAVI